MNDEDYVPLLTTLSERGCSSQNWFEALGKLSEWDKKGWEVEIGWVGDTCRLYWKPKDHPEEGAVLFIP